ncbi:glycosyltransferase family 2 protein [Seonamhaeicola sp. NFXS20]|uniref:glycosyltransferase family 2 protein n=1 Tax=unclassified Seonamhaeicola TaxID=2622645 RepID=UPI0035650C21
MSAFKVSIITPTYNSERFIELTITSILNQTYTNWELILIDDASTDKTVKIINQFVKSNSQIYLLQNSKNRGAAISRNKGIEAAKGDFIAFLDADDLWEPNKLKKQLKFMQQHNCDVCFSSYNLINEEGKPLNQQIKALPSVNYKKLLKSNYIGNLTGIYNAKTLGKITSKNLRKRQDWLIWLQAVKKSGKPALSIQEPLAFYRVRESSISSHKLNLVKYNYWVYKKGLGFSVLKSVYYLIVFLFEHFFIKSKQKITLI